MVDEFNPKPKYRRPELALINIAAPMIFKIRVACFDLVEHTCVPHDSPSS